MHFVPFQAVFGGIPRLRQSLRRTLLLSMALSVLLLAACSGGGGGSPSTETRKRCPRTDLKVPCDYGRDYTLYRTY